MPENLNEDLNEDLTIELDVLNINGTDRLIFEEKLETSVSLAQREGWHGGLLYIELSAPGEDGTPGRHGAFGGDAREKTLRDVRERLEEETRREDILLRVEDTRYIAWVQKAQVDQIVMIAERVRNRLQQPFKSATFGVTIGVSLYPYDGKTLDALLHRARLAFAQGRSAGRDIQVYDPVAADPDA